MLWTVSHEAYPWSNSPVPSPPSGMGATARRRRDAQWIKEGIPPYHKLWNRGIGGGYCVVFSLV